MKVNDIEIPEIFSYTDILVEKTEVNLTYSKSIPCFKDYDFKQLIGSVRLTTRNGTLYADIDLLGDYTGYYPGVAFDSDHRHVFALGINKNSNVDHEIGAL